MSRLAALIRDAAPDARPDGQLLAAFLHLRDEPAFAELVRRHGPLVWGVCRRSLPDAADAEDAFQAAFLVLVRRAHRLTHAPTVGPWLFKVAAWTARNLRRKNARRLARVGELPAEVAAPPTPEPPLDLDDALLALPERARAAVVLCHLEGLTHREAAERLGCAEGTVSSLVSRALARLRGRFAAPVVVPAALSAAAVRSAVAFHLTLPAASPAVVALTEGVLRMFWVKKLTTAAAVVLVVAGVGVTVSVQQAPRAVADDPPVTSLDRDIEMSRKVLAQLRASADASTKAAEAANLSARAQEDYIAALEGLRKKGPDPKALADLRKTAPKPPPPDLSAVEVIVGGKSVGVPVAYKEFDHQGKVIGGMGVDSPALVFRLLGRARADPQGPTTLRVVISEDAPPERVKAALTVCRIGWHKEAVVHGRIPTNMPGLKVTPPPNDAGGIGPTWYEANGLRLDLWSAITDPKPTLPAKW